jgi:hypothetical protein
MRPFFALALACAALLPLRAQMDPRLQNGNTDFMDLYQQSSSLKPKPEIASIFDCSGSMNSLMFHPLYQNADVNDADDYRYMVFTLTPKTTTAGTTTPAGNVYKITAKAANGCTSATAATLIVTVGSSGTTTMVANVPTAGCTTSSTTSTPTYRLTATAPGNTSATTSITFTPQTTTTVGSNVYFTNYVFNAASSNGTPTAGTYAFENAGGSTPATPTNIIVDSTNAGPYAYGSTVQLTVYLYHPYNAELDQPVDKTVTWSTSGGSVGTITNTEVTTGYFYKSVITLTLPSTKQTTTAANNTQLTPITVLSSTSGDTAYTSTYNSSAKTYTYSETFTSGTVLNLNAFFVSAGTSTQITWTTANNNTATGSSGGYIPPALIVNPSPATTTPSPTTSYNASSQDVTWTVPAYNTTGTSTGGSSTPGYVTVTLDATVSAYMTTNGLTAVGSLTSATNSASPYQVLRKPDGTAVTATDANAISSTSPLYGAASGELDVRNWIRAASHARFHYGSGSTERTIDIPIPWKNTMPAPVASNSGSQTLATGVPLSSTTALDQVTEASTSNGTAITTTYGSGLSIELDQTYRIEGTQYGVFSAHSSTYDFNGNPLTNSATNTVYLNVVYRPAYISWLFLGKYQSSTSLPYYNPTYTGKYIVFDAVANPSQVGGQSSQGSTYWGSGYGPVVEPWGSLTVSQYDTSGNYTGSTTSDASNYMIPAVTRIQAVKSAAIQTWIQHQADVYWAFRELDTTHEAQSSSTTNPGSATQIDDNSSTTITAATPIPPTTHLNGTDSGWTVLNNYLSTDTTTSTSGNAVTVLSSPTSSSVNGMTRISYLFASGDTPLTYAMARTLAQFEDPSSVFNAVEGSNVSQCQSSFLILFTDGIDNNGAALYNNTNTNTPYLDSTGLDAKAGNDAVILNPTNINPTGLLGNVPTSGPWWNLFTFAGIAAHLADPNMGVLGTDYMALGTPPTSASSPSAFLPLAISQRGSGSNLTAFSKPHLVTVMTVGVSLGGSILASGPKQNLFYTAICGDPSVTAGAVSTFRGFTPPTGTYGTSSWVANDWVTNPADPSDFPTIGTRKSGAVYFFDGSNPTTLTSAMSYAFKLAIGTAGNNTTASPNLPLIGASLGSQVYLGSFQPPSVGGVIWPGDLMMFSTVNTDGTVTIVDASGVAATTLNTTTAAWSASASFSKRYWDTVNPPTGSTGRKLYTRLPGSSSTPEPALIPFTYTNSAITGLLPSTLSATQKQKDVEFAMGGDITTANSSNSYIATANRSNIMGDIIDSAPTAQEYTWSYVQPLLASYSPVLAAASSGTRFRLILVGDNQGWMHAFGEVSWTVTDPANTAKTLTKGVVDELWAFMPTDFLPYLDYITHPTYTHRYMVNGTASIFFQDLPVGSYGPGNGTVDSGESCIAVFGLGKGGRSYYALNVNNPFVPTLQWSLRPDEATTFVASTRDLTGNTTPFATAILPNMGFSTSTPAFGKVTCNSTIYNAAFIGGGFSVPEIETVNFSGTHLGRSVMAVDVLTGNVLAAQDLTATNIGSTTVGPVGSPLVPFTFILNSGMTQRAYFTDYYGGLWSWGSKDVVTASPYTNFRSDSAELYAQSASSYHGWLIRKVFQDDNTSASGLGARYTTPPAPYRVAVFPGPAYNSQAVPAAVGIAMVSGDRNNPLDRSYTTSNVIPKWHQMTMVFDRQDSRALGLDNAPGSSVADTGIKPGITIQSSTTSSSSGVTSLLVPLNTNPVLTTPTNQCTDLVFQAFNQSCSPSSYFLGTSASPKYGYYVDFPIYSPSVTSTSTFISKGISAPVVVSGALAYDYFTPLTSDPCTGGTGNTYTWLIADVLHPIVDDQRSGLTTPSGLVMTWNGVASGFLAVGTTTIMQAGMINSTSGTTSTTTPYLDSINAGPASHFPKTRVWRTVQ